MSFRARGILVAVMLALPACQTQRQVGRVGDRYESCDSPELEQAEGALARGDGEAAIAGYRALVAACPRYVPGHERYQDLARHAGGEAEASMRAYYAELADDGSAVWPYLQGRLEGEFDERRLEQFEEALRRDPSFYFANLGLARIWRGLGRTQNELAVLERAIQAKPDSPEANLALASALTDLGRGEEAVPRFRNYLEQRPGDREAARQYVHLIVYGLHRADEAGPWVDRLLADDPADVAVRMDAAAVAWLRNDREQAAQIYREVIATDPTAVRAVLNLGNLYYLSAERPDEDKRRDWPRAREAYRAFLAIAEPEDLHDLLDLYAAVPARLARIDEFLGPLPEDAPPAPPD